MESAHLVQGRALAVVLIGVCGCRSPAPAPAIDPSLSAQRAAEQRSAPAPESAPTASASAAAPASAPASASAPPSAPGASDAASAAGANATVPDLAQVDGGLALHGSLQARSRLRTSGDAHDLDAYAVFALEVGDPTRDRMTGHLLTRISADVDGRGNAESQQRFGSLQDTYGEAVHVDVYEASVDYARPFDAELRLRAGRQLDYATPEFAHFDGVRLETLPAGRSKFVAGGFAGVPVRLYDATSASDQIAGVWTEGRPWEGGRVRADWMHVNQSTPGTDFHDDLLGIAAWQRVGTQLLVEGGYTRLEDENRDVRLRATWDDGRGETLVQAGYYRLLNPVRAFALEFDPYYETLQEYAPHSQYRLLVSKSLGDDLRLDLGGDLRRLESNADEAQFNHDYERGYATIVVSDALARGLDLSLTGDAWFSDGRDITTWGVDATWNADESWRASVGSAYSLYKYDVVGAVERDDVRVWYARLLKKLGKAWALDLEYAYEDDDFDDFETLIAGATWRF